MDAGGVIFVGDKGKIYGDKILPSSLRESYKAPQPYIPLHQGIWKNGYLPAKEANRPAPTLTGRSAYRISTSGQYCPENGFEEKLTKQVLKWDAEKFSFTNLPRLIGSCIMSIGVGGVCRRILHSHLLPPI